MKKYALAFVLCASNAYADSSSVTMQLPSPPMNYQSDRFRSGNLDCSNAIGGGTNLEFGVTGVITNYDQMNDYFNQPTQQKDIGVYARIVIPLDKPRSRINCNDLYRLELRQRRLEVQRLERELEQMRQLQSGIGEFEN